MLLYPLLLVRVSVTDTIRTGRSIFLAKWEEYLLITIPTTIGIITMMSMVQIVLGTLSFNIEPAPVNCSNPVFTIKGIERKFIFC